MPTAMSDQRLVRLPLLVLLATLAACGDHAATTAITPTAPESSAPASAAPASAAPASAAKGPAENAVVAGRVDPTFLTDLQAAFDATPWTRVAFSEELPDGTVRGYPESFAAGHYLAIAPVAGEPNPARSDAFAAYVPATQIPTPAGCILFRFAGAPAGSRFLVETFLPTWIDAGDLDVEHTTYRLDGAGDALAIASLRSHATPPAPWLLPPVTWVVTVDEPERGGGGDWTVDPGEDPGDD
jgi:hypothetical protein